MRGGVAGSCAALAADPAQAVVLTGAGRAFSAGVDLRRYLERGRRPTSSGSCRRWPSCSAPPSTLAKPVVAAVNGHAIAGGCVLAACADVTLMAEGNGRIGVPELKVGVPFPRVALEVLRHAVGEVAARRLVLGADTHAARRGAGDRAGRRGGAAPASCSRGRSAAARALATEIPAGHASRSPRPSCAATPGSGSGAPPTSTEPVTHAVDPAGHRRLDGGLPEVRHREVRVAITAST